MKDLLLIKNDLHLAEGDFQVGLSEPQHQKAILTAEKGQWKEHPEVLPKCSPTTFIPKCLLR